MKINENVKIIGKNVILVPYERKHVEKYHNWMKDRELLELTASQPLSLQEEYEMQETWRNDEDKCTFLILDKFKYEQTQDEIESLIGDTNIFLYSNEEQRTSEIEIMIAEKDCRGKKLGWESTLLMLNYGIQYLKIVKYLAIIKYHNDKSINMFKKLHFEEIKRIEVFKEITFGREVNETWLQWLNSEITTFEVEPYNK
uniref:Putative phosphoglucosamine acetyltransferase n=1 Tax=Corethrella appendiculata TaxID=1370023 RepID=U5EUM6_9DIPT